MGEMRKLGFSFQEMEVGSPIQVPGMHMGMPSMYGLNISGMGR